MADDNKGLVVKDRLEVPTDNGVCEIHLTYGSVTKLPKEDEVDVLVVSAFPSAEELLYLLQLFLLSFFDFMHR